MQPTTFSPFRNLTPATTTPQRKGNDGMWNPYNSAVPPSPPHPRGSGIGRFPNQGLRHHHVTQPKSSSPPISRPLVLQYLSSCQSIGIAPNKQLIRWLWKVKPHMGVINLSHIELPVPQLGCLISTLNCPLFSVQVSQVHTLSFNFGSIDDLGATLIANFARTLPRLHTLELFGNALSDHCCGALGALLTPPARPGEVRLQRLKLGDNQITDEGLAVLSQGLVNNTSLVHLHLGNNRVGDAGVMALAQALLSNSTLTSLCLRDNRLSTVGVAALCVVLAHHPSLADIQLKGNSISGPGLKHLASAISAHRHLRVLDLQQTGLNATDATLLANGLATNQHIHAVNLNDNQIGDLGCDAIMQALRQNAVVMTFGLRANSIEALGSNAVAETLMSNTALTGLDLGLNQAGDSGALVLGYALQFNTALQSLDLRANGLTLSGSRILAHALCCNTTLKHIDLSGNENGDEGATEWAKVLLQNRSLTRLSLADSAIGENGGTEILVALQSNTTLRYFGIGGSALDGNNRSSAPRAGGPAASPPTLLVNRLSPDLRRAIRSILIQHGARMVGDNGGNDDAVPDHAAEEVERPEASPRRIHRRGGDENGEVSSLIVLLSKVSLNSDGTTTPSTEHPWWSLGSNSPLALTPMGGTSDNYSNSSSGSYCNEASLNGTPDGFGA